MSEQIQRDAGAHDIGDGIGRADFVEVNFFDGHAVDLRFGFAQALEDGGGVGFDAGGEGRARRSGEGCAKDGDAFAGLRRDAREIWTP